MQILTTQNIDQKITQDNFQIHITDDEQQIAATSSRILSRGGDLRFRVHGGAQITETRIKEHLQVPARVAQMLQNILLQLAQGKAVTKMISNFTVIYDANILFGTLSPISWRKPESFAPDGPRRSTKNGWKISRSDSQI
jgi:hypothetical protein